jgi:HPt (histidine-containing phosphotransfer) domain-containing protein
MLSGPFTCRAAVHRSIRARSEAIWITDDVLSRALQRFCLIALPLQRNASSVPGPMESRRRIGKRRIAHLSEAFNTTGQDFGLLWGLTGASDRQQWEWEAPSRRQPLPAIDGTPHLPAWLSDYEPISVDDLRDTSEVEESILDREGLSKISENDLRTFKEALKASSTQRIQDLCDTFNQSFKQKLILGLVSREMLIESLQNVTEAIRQVTDDKLLADLYCLLFYKATWHGMTGCKVLWPADFGADLLNKLLVLLGELHCAPAVQDLAIDVICTASQDHLTHMEDGVLKVAKAWLSSWSSVGIDCELANMELTPSHHLEPVMPKRQSLKESAANLVKFLGQLQSNITPPILHASTDHLISIFANLNRSFEILRTLRYSWLSVIANMPRVGETLLLEIWSRMDFSPASSKNSGHYAPNIRPLRLRESCNLLLDFWISHGQIKEAGNLRATYLEIAQKSGHSDSAGSLLQALNQCKERWWSKAECLFRILRGQGKPKAVYGVFRGLLAQNLIPAAYSVGREIYYMSRIDPRLALEMYKLYNRVEHDKTRFLLDWCPNLVIAMIRSPDFAPAEIWSVLRVPVLDPKRRSMSCKPLHPARIRLIHRMALEFAAADCRSPRLALRNVVQCMLYLRRHGVPVSTDLSRALTEAGIARSILDQRCIGRRKAEWIIEIVRQVEGCEVSTKMDQILQTWLTKRIAEQKRLNREGNPLGIGPID